MSELMTKTEAANLERLIRKQERVLKAACDQRAAELGAEFEAQISSVHHYTDDPKWKATAKHVAKLLAEAEQEVEDRCDELGIPEEFRPSIHWSWSSRSENAVAQRRTELRFRATSEIEAIRKAARTKVESWSLETQTDLAARNLTTEAAKEFLKKMPRTAELMPSLEFEDIERKVIADKRIRPW